MKINHTITHGNTASVDGTMKMKDLPGEEKTYAFCNVYEFNGFKNPETKAMNSYVLEVK